MRKTNPQRKREMSNRVIKISLSVLCLAMLGCGEAYAQKHPERRHIRAGNKDYEALEYGAAEGDYRSALIKEPDSYEAAFNLGDALYKQERFEEAESVFNQILENPNLALTKEQEAKVKYNIGNAQFGQQKLKEAVTSYVESLIVNPDDIEAKYNLAYVQKLLENEPQGGGGGGDGQNDENKQNQDQNQDPNQENNSGEEQDQEGDQQDDERNQDDPGEDDGQPEKPEPGEESEREAAISKDDAEKMLDAIQMQEDKTREKVNEQKKATVGRSGKNW